MLLPPDKKGDAATHQQPLGAVAWCPLLLLTCALLMMSCHSKALLGSDESVSYTQDAAGLHIAALKKPTGGGKYTVNPNAYTFRIHTGGSALGHLTWGVIKPQEAAVAAAAIASASSLVEGGRRESEVALKWSSGGSGAEMVVLEWAPSSTYTYAVTNRVGEAKSKSSIGRRGTPTTVWTEIATVANSGAHLWDLKRDVGVPMITSSVVVRVRGAGEPQVSDTVEIVLHR